ncbi:serine protease [Shewanella marina]|uniref:serine protease n=1 Tax=Shewanella marina TaxID=487319 RepID=UPI000561AE94|nr:serine protease [Shewanella marina]
MNSSNQDDLLHEIKSVKDQHEQDLLKLDNVNGVGIGYKESKGKQTDQLCICVFVNQKQTEKSLSKAQLVPKNIDNIKTDVIEVGNIEAQALTAKIRPAKPGFSLGHYAITAGTFGAIAKDSVYPGRYYILSNNHVLANSNAASIGDRILQPGRLDGGLNYANTIARLSRYVPITFGSPNNYNLVDAAIAKPISQKLVQGSIHRLGIPKGTKEASLNMAVIKSGRTTETTTGNVISVDATIAVNYGSSGVAYFRNQFLTRHMSNGGDSGSLLLEKDSRKAVGLLFAGSSQVTVFNHIHNVLMALNIDLLTE